MLFRKTAQGNIFHPILFIYGAKYRSFKIWNYYIM